MRVKDLEGANEVVHLFDAFTDLWTPALSPSKSNSRAASGSPDSSAPSSQQIAPLMHLAARAYIGSKAEAKVKEEELPKELKWFLAGMRGMKVYDASSEKKHYCDRRNIVRGFGFRVEIGGEASDDAENNNEEAGDDGRMGNGADTEFYGSGECNKWKCSNVTFVPDKLNPLFSYDVSAPRHLRGDVIPLAKIVANGLGASQSWDESPGTWFSASGSMGGRWAEHKSNTFSIGHTNPMDWNHVEKVRSAVGAFAENMRKASSKVWERDKFTVCVTMRGTSQAELDLCAEMFRARIFDGGTPGKMQESQLESRCWFQIASGPRTKLPILDTQVVREVMEGMVSGTAVFDLEIPFKAMSEKRMQEETDRLKAVHTEIIAGDASASPAWQRGAAKIWQKSAEGTYRCSLRVRKLQRIRKPMEWSIKNQCKSEDGMANQDDTISTETNAREAVSHPGGRWVLELGCYGCNPVLGYRSGGNDPEKILVTGSMCPIHKSLLLAPAEVSPMPICEPERIAKSKGSVLAAMSTIVDPELVRMFYEEQSKSLAQALFDYEEFSRWFPGMKCGRVLSHPLMWFEKDMNEMVMNSEK
jgi:hypothetical protein